MMESYESYDELLYGNLKLLSLRYQMSTELKDMLSKEMFAVANTKAFCHVIMYLLNCLNKEKYGRKLPWPVHDKASHMRFHNCVWEVSRSINADYLNADLPKVQKSFFMNPTGKKFVQYLVKLSSLVMLENSKFGQSFYAKQPKDINVIKRKLAVMRFNLKENYDESETHKHENKIKIRDMISSIQKHEKIVISANDMLRKVVEKSKLDAATKERFLSHDENAIKEIKQNIEEKKKMLQEFIQRVNNMKTNLHELNDVIRSPQNSICGKHLVSCLPSAIVENISINEETGITLEDLMNVLCESVNLNKRKLLMEDMANDFPKLVTLKNNLEKLLEKYETFHCEMKSFIGQVKMPDTSNSDAEECAGKRLFTLKETNLEYLNITTPRSLCSPSTPLSLENAGLIVDWVNKESRLNKPLKQGLFFSPPSVDTSYMIDANLQQSCIIDANLQQSEHKVKAKYLMSTCKKTYEQKHVEKKSPVIVPKNNLARRVLVLNSPQLCKSNTMCRKIEAENAPNLATIALNGNNSNLDVEIVVQDILHDADSFPKTSESSLTFDELESINENCVSDSLASDWNNDSFHRIASLMLSPDVFLPSNGNSTPLLQDVTASPVEQLLSKEPKVSKISRPSLESLRLRFLKVKETALTIPKLDD